MEKLTSMFPLRMGCQYILDTKPEGVHQPVSIFLDMFDVCCGFGWRAMFDHRTTSKFKVDYEAKISINRQEQLKLIDGKADATTLSAIRKRLTLSYATTWGKPL